MGHHQQPGEQTTPMNSLVSIVIPHWNHRNVLVDCLRSLAQTEYAPLEILVVDNHSTDDSVQYVRENFPKVRVVQNQENLGFAGGCNRGLRVVSGNYVVILNNDTTQEPDWLSILVRYMEAHPEVGIAQPKLKNALNPALFDYSGAAGGYMDKYAFPFARGRIFDSVEQDDGQYDESVPVFWASGTACILRREVLDEVGDFDEIFFAHMEEIDLDWRAHLAGWDVAAVPEAVVYHHSGYTLPMESPLKKYLNHRNSIFMLLANYNLWHACIRGFQRWLLDGLALAFSLFSGDLSRAMAVVKAWWWIFTHPGKIYAKRKKVKKIRRRSDTVVDQTLFQASIALERFLLRHRKWESRRHSLPEVSQKT